MEWKERRRIGRRTCVLMTHNIAKLFMGTTLRLLARGKWRAMRIINARISGLLYFNSISYFIFSIAFGSNQRVQRQLWLSADRHENTRRQYYLRKNKHFECVGKQTVDAAYSNASDLPRASKGSFPTALGFQINL